MQMLKAPVLNFKKHSSNKSVRPVTRGTHKVQGGFGTRRGAPRALGAPKPPYATPPPRLCASSAPSPPPPPPAVCRHCLPQVDTVR